jgi:hypothetical protein
MDTDLPSWELSSPQMQLGVQQRTTTHKEKRLAHIFFSSHISSVGTVPTHRGFHIKITLSIVDKRGIKFNIVCSEQVRYNASDI